MPDPEPSEEALRARAFVLECIVAWQPDTFSLSHDGPRPGEDAHSDDSYYVEWQMRLEPVARTACPLEIWFAIGFSEHTVGFGFDTWAGLARRLKLHSRRIPFVFGIEPIRLRPEQIRAILSTVYEGHVEARYWSAFGRLLHADGRLLVDVGIPHLNRMTFGASYRYSPYTTR